VIKSSRNFLLYRTLKNDDFLQADLFFKDLKDVLDAAEVWEPPEKGAAF